MSALPAFVFGCATIASAKAETPGPAGESEPAESVVEEDLMGLFHGSFIAVEKPVRTVDYPAAGIRRLLTTPDAKRAVIYEFTRDDGSRSAVIDLETGKATELDKVDGALFGRRFMALAADGKSVVVDNPGRSGDPVLARLFDLETGRRIREYRAPDDKPAGGLSASADGRRMAAGSRTLGAVHWDLASGDAAGVPLDFVPKDRDFLVFPISGKQTLLVVVKMPAEKREAGGDGEEAEDPIRLVLVEPENGATRVLTEISGRFDLLLEPTGRRMYLLLMKEPEEHGWSHLQCWDLESGKAGKAIRLQPAIASVDCKLTRDEKHLFILSYLSQQGVVFELPAGTARAVVAPQLGGFMAFDITPDGRNLVGASGSWVQGSLRADKITVFDCREIIGDAPRKDEDGGGDHLRENPANGVR